MLHRNSQKRIYFNDAIYFVTTTTYNNFPYFKEEIFAKILIKQIEICKKIKNFKLYGFVIIPNHMHILFEPNNKFDFSNIIQSIKRNSSCNINKIISSSSIPERANSYSRQSNSFSRQSCDNMNCRLRPYSDHDSLQQYGLSPSDIENFDIFLQKQIIAFQQKYPHNTHHIPKFQWHKSFHDHYIRNQKDFNNHLNYIWRNPIKHGLTKNNTDYPFSSLKNYDNLINDIE